MMIVEWAVPGRRVVCIEGKGWNTVFVRYPAVFYPEYKKIYTIREVYRDVHRPEVIGLLLEEIRNDPVPELGGRESGFHISGFRPLKETNIDIFNKILREVPKEKVLEKLS